jgi:hypothetical protein
MSRLPSAQWSQPSIERVRHVASGAVTNEDDELYGFGCRSNVSSAAVDHHRRSPALVCWSVSPYMPISAQSSLAEAYFESRLCAAKA